MKKEINLILAVVIALVLGGAGFYGGTMYQKAQSAKTRGNFANRAGGTRLGQGTNGQNQARPISGDVIAQDDKSFTVKLVDGSTRIVLFSDSATISKSTAGAKADIATGEKVMVIGTVNSDKSITPQSISIGAIIGR